MRFFIYRTHNVERAWKETRDVERAWEDIRAEILSELDRLREAAQKKKNEYKGVALEKFYNGEISGIEQVRWLLQTSKVATQEQIDAIGKPRGELRDRGLENNG